jgi:hypothetical protein
VVSDFSEDVSTSAEGTNTNNGNTRTVTNWHSCTIELVLDPIALGSLGRNNVIIETLINGFNVNVCLTRAHNLICRQFKLTTALIVVDNQGSLIPQRRVHDSIDDLLLKPGTCGKIKGCLNIIPHVQIMRSILLAYRP